MRAYVAVTDRDWYRFLRDRPDLDAVNFWQPGGSRQFRSLKPGEPFLFKLHYPENKIVGGGMFAHSSILDSRFAGMLSVRRMALIPTMRCGAV